MGRKIRRWARAVVVLAGVASACGTMSSDELGEQSIKLIEEMASLAEAHKTDCEKMGAELDGFVRAKEPVLKKLAGAAKKHTPEERAKYEEKFRARTEAATKRLSEHVTACAGHATVQAAMQGLGDAMRHP